jgi:nucleotide-binding universal stress UspA family protein
MTNCSAPAPTALHLARILAPVDFSDRCRRATRDAELLARRFGSVVVLLHAVAPVAIPFGPAEAMAYTTTADISREQMDQMAPVLESVLADELRGVSTCRVLVEGSPAHAITEHAAERHCDLIVMPTHGYGALHRIVAGSVTTEVLRHAPCPVWTGCHFDETPEPVRPRSVVCAAGLTAHDEAAEAWAAGLARAYDARFQVLDAPPPYSDPDYIAARAKAAEADVLVVSRGPRTYSLVRACHCPVVAV